MKSVVAICMISLTAGMIAGQDRGALAWLLARKPWIVRIPGTTKLQWQKENIGAAAVELTSYDLGDIERAAARITAEGLVIPSKSSR